MAIHQIRLNPSAVARALGAIAFLLVLASIGGQLTKYLPGHKPIYGLVNLTYVDATNVGEFNIMIYAASGSALAVGTGCGGAGVPTLTLAPPPRLGEIVLLSLTQGTPNRSGGIFFGPVPSGPTLLPGGCAVFFDPANFAQLLPLETNASGGWSMPFAVTSDPAMAGFRAMLQAALLSTSGPLGIDLSNGVDAIIGF